MEPIRMKAYGKTAEEAAYAILTAHTPGDMIRMDTETWEHMGPAEDSYSRNGTKLCGENYRHKDGSRLTIWVRDPSRRTPRTRRRTPDDYPNQSGTVLAVRPQPVDDDGP